MQNESTFAATPTRKTPMKGLTRFDVGFTKTLFRTDKRNCIIRLRMKNEISVIERELSDGQSVGFCHNDLLYDRSSNHFCEMAADYHTDTPHVLDYEKYPGLDERRRFVRVYLCHSGDTPIDAEVDKLLEDVEKYTLGSHMFWGLWGILSVLQEHAIEIELITWSMKGRGFNVTGPHEQH